ncbi:MAG: hypothetical protein MUO88_05320, partial [Desulfobacterales bacterium]|nr:hypothetical protein [Desulfobacterales bacterium]
ASCGWFFICVLPDSDNQNMPFFWVYCMYYSIVEVIVKWNMKCGISETVCEIVIGKSNDEKARIKAAMFFLLAAFIGQFMIGKI